MMQPRLPLNRSGQEGRKKPDLGAQPMVDVTDRRQLTLLVLTGGLAGTAMLLLAGCSGAPTRTEEAARQDLTEVKSRYRPDGARGNSLGNSYGVSRGRSSSRVARPRKGTA